MESIMVGNAARLLSFSWLLWLLTFHVLRLASSKLRKPTKFLSTPISRPLKMSLINSMSMFI
ncbi:hypothetical protein CR513_39311, partial [Mucuna pruriens]